jgi:hypothetical protein
MTQMVNAYREIAFKHDPAEKYCGADTPATSIMEKSGKPPENLTPSL